MSIIKAYKFNTNIIPVDEANIIDVYRCPWTRKIFTIRKSYIDHLHKYRENTIREKIRVANWEKIRDELNSQPDFDSVVQWIEANSRWFISNGQKNIIGRPTTPVKIPSDFKIKIKRFTLEYYDKISNSHCCPRDGVKNWSRVIELPGHYPGWHGLISYTTSHDITGIGSNMFTNTGINTGSGGSGRECQWSYAVSLFASDWPIMQNTLILQRCEALLRNNQFFNTWHYES